MLNSSGPSIEPCGSTVVILYYSLRVFFTLILCFMFVKQLFMHLKASVSNPHTPNLAIKKSWFNVSKAFAWTDSWRVWEMVCYFVLAWVAWVAYKHGWSAWMGCLLAWMACLHGWNAWIGGIGGMGSLLGWVVCYCMWRAQRAHEDAVDGVPVLVKLLRKTCRK